MTEARLENKTGSTGVIINLQEKPTYSPSGVYIRCYFIDTRLCQDPSGLQRRSFARNELRPLGPE